MIAYEADDFPRTSRDCTKLKKSAVLRSGALIGHQRPPYNQFNYGSDFTCILRNIPSKLMLNSHGCWFYMQLSFIPDLDSDMIDGS